MSPSVNELPTVDPDSGRLNVVVDTPKGSRTKYKFDEKHDQWRLSKVLPQGLSLPYDFGFLPSRRRWAGRGWMTSSTSSSPTTRWKGGSSSRSPGMEPTAPGNSWSKGSWAPAREATVLGAHEARARNESAGGRTPAGSSPEAQEAIPCPSS